MSGNVKETLSSKNSVKLRVEFYESGVGDTIVITFPSGDVGLVDAHPSSRGSRPDILEIIKNKKLRFVCLTHPHADHGVDLIPVLRNHPEINEFWHTIFEIPALFFGIEQIVNFPSAVRDYAAKMNKDWGEFLVDIFALVIERKIPRHHLRSDLREMIIDGVEIHCLGPDKEIQNRFFNAYHKRLTDPKARLPDPNIISAILALKFGKSVLLLGGDALKQNWETAVLKYRQQNLPKACVLKVPHHGARNAFDLKKNAVTYLNICSNQPKAKSVIFAGDARHPDCDVYSKLRQRTEVFCLSNGLKSRPPYSNPLNINLKGARLVSEAPICNPIISFELDMNGNVFVLSGCTCDSC